MVDPVLAIINNTHIRQFIMKNLINKTLTRFGAYIIGISLLSGLMYLMFMYPPVIPLPVEGYPYPEYSPYPGVEHEYRLYLEERYLEYRRAA